MDREREWRLVERLIGEGGGRGRRRVGGGEGVGGGMWEFNNLG